MKKRLFGLALAASMVSLAACGGSANSPNEMTYVSWGGALQKAQDKAILAPFAKQNGIKVLQESPTDYAKLKAQVEAKSVNWDVVQVEPYIAERGCKEGWLTILPSSVRVDGVGDEFSSKCAVPAFQYAFVIGYNTDAFPGDHPTTWADFFDTKKFPGKRGFWKFASSGILEAALLADGVAPDKLYPLDLDRAFKKLDTIKNDIVFYDTGEQQTQLVSSGEVSMVQAWNGRMFDAIKDGQPVGIDWGQNMVVHETWVVPKGAPHKANAMKFLAYADGAQAQARMTKYIPYAPINKDALKAVNPKMADYLPTTPKNADKSSIVIDYGWYAKHFDSVTKRFNDWLVSS